MVVNSEGTPLENDSEPLNDTVMINVSSLEAPHFEGTGRPAQHQFDADADARGRFALRYVL